MTKNNKCLFISLAVSLVLIIVGVVMFSVLGGFNDDGFTKDKTVITVTGDPIVTVREDFRNDLDELCKTTLEDAGRESRRRPLSGNDGQGDFRIHFEWQLRRSDAGNVRKGAGNGDLHPESGRNR